MFTKKFTFALLLTPLFVGCVVEGDGDTDADTDPTSVGPSSVGTDDSTGASSITADTGVSATEDTGPATGDETAGTGAETAGTETGGGGGMFCQQTCTEAVDCCAPGTKAIGCPTDYPVHWECTDGLCEYQGCAGDKDCATAAGTTCHDVAGFPSCVPLCTVETEDTDCLVDMGETCTGMTDDGDLYCLFQAEPCMAGGCGDLVCNETTGFCECDGDDDCAGDGQGGTCDLETGACTCLDAAGCGEGFDCVAF